MSQFVVVTVEGRLTDHHRTQFEERVAEKMGISKDKVLVLDCGGRVNAIDIDDEPAEEGPQFQTQEDA